MNIRPTEMPGFNVVGRQTGTIEDLANRAFVTTCEPDVPPSGTESYCRGLRCTNYGSLASPSEDGWFLSGFYLFYHLLSATSQLWLTCEDPEELVKKYKEYAHGDSTGERRIMLDEQCLPKIKQTGNL
jgi:hypothetical protein